MRINRKSRPDATQILDAAYHTGPLGPFWSLWTAGGLYRIDWKTPSEDPNGRILSPTRADLGNRIRHFEKALESYFAGELEALTAVEVDPAEWTPFFTEVYRVCRSIPAGQTLTYGELAERAGRPGAARAVGQAMATNRVMWVIPCHRVLASGGRLCGYGGPGGLETKRWLLDHEQAEYAERSKPPSSTAA